MAGVHRVSSPTSSFSSAMGATAFRGEVGASNAIQQSQVGGEGEQQQQHGIWNSENFEAHFAQIKEQSKMKVQQGQVVVGEGREIRADEIDLGIKLGEGQFARVYKATCRGKSVAVKVLSIDKCDQTFIEEFKHEIEVMSKINHPNVCLYMGACTSVPGKMMIVTQLYAISLEKVLFSQTPLSLPARMRIAKEIALGMNWLHSMTPKLIHSDLKTSNILLDDNGHAVVCDFGQTQILRGIVKDIIGWGGTPLYMAPEKLLGLPHNEKVDVYSFGLILWELAHRQHVFETHARANNLPAFIGAVCDRKERPTMSRECPQQLVSLIASCWAADAENRPAFKDIVPARLDPIILECTIPDQVGRRFWTSKFGSEQQVPWKTFKPIFSSFVGRTQSLYWVKPLIVVQSEKRGAHLDAVAAAAASTGLVVTMELFGNFLEYFGPLADVSQSDKASVNVVDKAQQTLMADWFHGDIDSNESAKILRADGRIGAYLIRFSARDPGTFTISRITGTKDNKEINHQRIRNQAPNGLVYGGANFVSLIDFVAKMGKQLTLKHPINDPKFKKMIERWQEKTKKKPSHQQQGFQSEASKQEGIYGNDSEPIDQGSVNSTSGSRFAL